MLQQQVPTMQFTLFQNFNGKILELILWHKMKIDLPYQTSKLPEGMTELLSSAILHYKFDAGNYDGSTFKSLVAPRPVDSSSIASLFAPASSSVDQPGLIASIGGGLEFESVLVPLIDQVNYASPDWSGQLNATSTLFDGVGCPDPDLSQFLLSGSQAAVSLTVLSPKTDKMTVEFWFRVADSVASMPSPNYLFSMSSSRPDGSTSESMAIFIDKDGLLKCAPFGTDSDPATILVYEGVIPNQINSWQHVSCIYDRDRAVSGEHLAFNSNSGAGPEAITAVKKALLAKRFTRSIVSAGKRIPGYVRPTEFLVVLGNNPTMS